MANYIVLVQDKSAVQNILTVAYLYDRDVLSDIEAFIEQIENILLEKGISRQPDVELVLERFADSGPEADCGYYFVSHKDRCLFWYEEFDISHILKVVKGVHCRSQISVYSPLLIAIQVLIVLSLGVELRRKLNTDETVK